MTFFLPISEGVVHALVKEVNCFGIGGSGRLFALNVELISKPPVDSLGGNITAIRETCGGCMAPCDFRHTYSDSSQSINRLIDYRALTHRGDSGCGDEMDVPDEKNGVLAKKTRGRQEGEQKR